MGNWVQGNWVWEVGWRRGLLERETIQVQLLFSIINNVSVTADTEDTWRWNASNNGVYSSKSAYNIFGQLGADHNQIMDNKVTAGIWKAMAPLKARVTGWRILKGKMATCENLARRNVVINEEEAKCVACNNCSESSQHFFFSCRESMEVWNNILQWLGVLSVLGQRAKNHLLLFSNLGTRLDRGFLTGVWCGVVWCLWKWRNDIKFNNMEWDKAKIIAEVKSRLWTWKWAFGGNVLSDDFNSWISQICLLGLRRDSGGDRG